MTVLVTGAAGGIGSAVAEAFEKAGHVVVRADRESVVDGVELDVTDPAAVERAVAEIEDRHGPIDTLANVAGILRTGPVVDLSDEDWAALFAVNTTGVFVVSRAVARRMIPRRAGAIITVSSNAGAVPRQDMAGYAASKAAATMFTKSLGLELAGYGIRCNVVAPGSTDTPMLGGMDTPLESFVDGAPAAYKVGIPLRKIATPRDIADAVLFLGSPAAGHITMQELLVDGGAALGG
ncbi:SDR family oxidoreductase [Amycolatopsis acidicola]|uniref:SDR family oxidoreductase n=1 Tax=Amycolatopsis acidicola TaxID=2596893 RepID=A0A5N0UYK4_9PSEU|nr:SDR family oxidoreductase [Amycolatopsis acidicola]KAA9158724.1 SDR family oxidoreductase [Amycolatopsis acidicola]